MADRDHTTYTDKTTTGTTGTTRPEYRDPRTTPTTSRRRTTSWIGAIVAVLAIIVVAAWWAGTFEREDTAMMVGEPVVEGTDGTALQEQGAVPADAEVEVLEVPATPTPPAQQ